MGQVLKIADVKDVPPGGAIAVEADGRKIALFQVGDRYYAIDDTCTHRGGPLSQGEIEGTVVTCPWHGACFDLTTGDCHGPPAPKGVACYAVQVDGSEIKVELP